MRQLQSKRKRLIAAACQDIKFNTWVGQWLVLVNPTDVVDWPECTIIIYSRYSSDWVAHYDQDNELLFCPIGRNGQMAWKQFLFYVKGYSLDPSIQVKQSYDRADIYTLKPDDIQSVMRRANITSFFFVRLVYLQISNRRTFRLSSRRVVLYSCDKVGNSRKANRKNSPPPILITQSNSYTLVALHWWWQWINNRRLFQFDLFIGFRNPWTRLLSSYVALYLDSDYVMRTKQPCEWISKDTRLTFQDFLTCIVATARQKGVATMDTHWRPQYLSCDPCHVKYSHIGHMESLGKSDIIETIQSAPLKKGVHQ